MPTNKSAYYVAREAACLAKLGRMDEARLKASTVLAMKPGFSLNEESPVYQNAVDAEHLLEAMRMAGLPD